MSRNGDARFYSLWLGCLSMGPHQLFSGISCRFYHCSQLILRSVQFGYHISVLNQIQAVLTCQNTTPDVTGVELPKLTTCIPMSQVAFSFVTAIFTIGGLSGSLVANMVMDSIGRRGTHRLGAVLVLIGTAFMGLGTSLFPFLLGR
jgi:MFS family permease